MVAKIHLAPDANTLREVVVNDPSDADAQEPAAESTEEELIEEVSIDGMCGVY